MDAPHKLTQSERDVLDLILREKIMRQGTTPSTTSESALDNEASEKILEDDAETES